MALARQLPGVLETAVRNKTNAAYGPTSVTVEQDTAWGWDGASSAAPGSARVIGSPPPGQFGWSAGEQENDDTPVPEPEIPVSFTTQPTFMAGVTSGQIDSHFAVTGGLEDDTISVVIQVGKTVSNTIAADSPAFASQTQWVDITTAATDDTEVSAALPNVLAASHLHLRLKATNGTDGSQVFSDAVDVTVAA